MPYTGPIWVNDNIPHTDCNADIVLYEKASDVTVIEVRGARYRNSKPLDGFFELVNPDRDPRSWRGIRAEVYCLWHGVRPIHTWPNIDLSDATHVAIHKSFQGNVVRNIA